MNEQQFNEALQLLANDRRKATTCALIKKMGYRRGRKLLERELKKIHGKKESKARIISIDQVEVKPSIQSSSGDNPLSTEGKVESVKAPSISRSKGGKLYLREEFPFLADNECPDILKILVSNMLTAHDKYVKGHQALFDVAHKDNATCFQSAREVVENYIENRSIWEELEHYRKTKTLLGQHPLFELQRKKEQMLYMKEEDLRKYAESIRKKIWKRVDMIKNNPDDPRLEKWRNELKQLEAEQEQTEKLRQKIGAKTRGRKPKVY